MLEDVHATYLQINSWFDDPSLRNEYVGSMPWMRMRELNDYAYYVLIFSQFEIFVNDEFSYKMDQVLEFQKIYSEKLDFMEKVAVTFNDNGAICKLVNKYYELRCEIAHGNVDERLFVEFGKKYGKQVTIGVLSNDMANLMKYSF